MPDPISDYINRLKNASAVKKETVTISYSKIKEAISNLLKSEGYISSLNIKGKNARKSLEIGLSYNKNGSSKIHQVRRVSKPSRRVYKGLHQLRPVKFGKGSLILSTPQGILTDKEARKTKVGGEALFEIY